MGEEHSIVNAKESNLCLRMVFHLTTIPNYANIFKKILQFLFARTLLVLFESSNQRTQLWVKKLNCSYLLNRLEKQGPCRIYWFMKSQVESHMQSMSLTDLVWKPNVTFFSKWHQFASFNIPLIKNFWKWGEPAPLTPLFWWSHMHSTGGGPNLSRLEENTDMWGWKYCKSHFC